MEPLVQTKITNPTAAPQNYKFVGHDGIYLDSGESVVIPFEVMTGCITDAARLDLIAWIAEKRITISYIIKGASATVGAPVKAAEKAPKPSKPVVDPKSEAAEEAEKKAADEKAAKQILKEESTVKQPEEVSMRKAMGWKEDVADTPRPDGEVKLSTAMEESMKDNSAKLEAADKPAAPKAAAKPAAKAAAKPAAKAATKPAASKKAPASRTKKAAAPASKKASGSKSKSTRTKKA